MLMVELYDLLMILLIVLRGILLRGDAGICGFCWVGEMRGGILCIVLCLG